MKTHLVAAIFSLASILVPNSFGQAPASPVASRELAIVVVESLGSGISDRNDFDRLDLAFTKVFAQRKWPAKIVVERFAANGPAHDTELRVFLKGIYEEMPGDLTFHAWMTLQDHGKKRDFGIVRFRYYRRPGERMDEILDKVFEGAAVVTADKIEPLLFPKTEKPKP